MLLLPLLACATVEGYFHEVREDPETVALSGYLYRTISPDTEDPVVVGDALVEFTALDGGLLSAGEELYPNRYPGYWGADLPPNTEYELRVDQGEGSYPALWRGRSPVGDGFWPGSGALLEEDQRAGVFGWQKDQVDGFFASVAEAEGVTIQALDDGQVVHVWGGPNSPDLVRGDGFQVIGGDGESAQVYTYGFDAISGELARTAGSPVHYILAFNLAPGEVVVAYEDDQGRAETTYNALGGDLLAPWFFEGP